MQAAFPFFTVRGRIVGRDERVSRRIPLLIINAIQDAAQIGSPVLYHPFKSPAECGGLDLPGILLADRVEQGGVVNAPFEQVDLIVHFQLKIVEMLPADAEHIHQAGIEIPLMLHVVEGQQ